jgi:hypothetical protein
MSHSTIVAATVLTLLLPAGPVAAQGQQSYGHPDLAMQFTAAPGWIHEPRPGDEGTHELVDPETGIHVLMWYTSTEQSARSYLSKMSSMMDLLRVAEPRPRTINGRDAWVVDALGFVADLPVETMLALIPSGKSRRHPRENNLYIVQIWCPAVDAARLADRMRRLLASVQLTDRVVLAEGADRFYPATTETRPDIPSPSVATDGETYVIVRTQDGGYGLVQVTVENGAPNDYERGEWGKGRQLDVDADDFPTLARTGLHSKAELDRTTSITGRTVAEITARSKPGQMSGAGFVAQDEEIVDVIRGDNRVVARLGLNHPLLARPLFEIFNLILRDLELFRLGQAPIYNIASVLYAGHEIHIEASASKGWQESIFADNVKGYWSIRIWREPTADERRYLNRHYGHLGAERLAALTEMLTSIHTGEMVPFYIMRYGFYEGHTEYRADPLAIANLFRLVSIEKIDAATGHDLYGALTRHYRRNGAPRNQSPRWDPSSSDDSRLTGWARVVSSTKSRAS